MREGMYHHGVVTCFTLMLRTLLFALVAMASLHAEEPVLPPEAKPLLGDAPLQPTQPKAEEGRITKT